MISLARRLFYVLTVSTVSTILLVVSFPVAAIWRRKTKRISRDKSWEFGRSLIYKLGIGYWEDILCDFRLKIKGEKVLEVGAGNGQWLIALDNLGAGEVIGIEPNDNVRSYGLERLREHGKFERVVLEKAAAERIPFSDSYFDCLLCMGVFMFTKQSQAMGEFNRVLRPGGSLLLTVNGLGYFLMKLKDGILFSQKKEITYGLIGTVNTLVKWMTGIQFGVCAVSVSETKEMLDRFGFKLERVWIHNDIDLYPLEHFYFPTNYAFRAIKV